MRNFISLFMTFLVFSVNAQTQEVTSVESKSGLLSHLSIGLRASTLGMGVQAATPINDYLNLRGGFDFINFTRSGISMKLKDPQGAFDKAFGYTPEYDMKATLNFANANIMVDFHPMKGIFHLTGGVLIGANKLKAKGNLVDENGNPVKLKSGEYEWPELNFDKYKLLLDDSNLDANLKLGGLIKPYLGIGVGRAIAKNNRLSFKFELGVIYQGDYDLRQNGQKVDFSEENIENFEKIDTYTRWLKWWPMMNFQLSYAIF